MEKVKYLFQHMLIIAFGILAGITVEGIFYGEEINFQWYHPLSILITSIVCAVPSLIFWNDRETPKKQFAGKIFLHFLVLGAMVLGIGRLFNWYTMWVGALFVAIIYVFVYAFVWIAGVWMASVDGKNINNALSEIRDEE